MNVSQFYDSLLVLLSSKDRRQRVQQHPRTTPEYTELNRKDASIIRPAIVLDRIHILALDPPSSPLPKSAKCRAAAEAPLRTEKLCMFSFCFPRITSSIAIFEGTKLFQSKDGSDADIIRAFLVLAFTWGNRLLCHVILPSLGPLLSYRQDNRLGCGHPPVS